jgi:hypothetical protein
VQTLSIFFQAVTAGMLLSSSHGALLHDVGSRVMWGASLLYVLAAILAWRPGGGTPRPILYATVFLALAWYRSRWASRAWPRSMSPWAS